MVENFTKNDEITYEDTPCMTNELEQAFEDKLKANIEQFMQEPSSSTIDNIMNYSKSFSK